MTAAAKKWLSRFIKFAVCAAALLYLSGKVTLEDYVRLAQDPDKRYVLVESDDDHITIRDPQTGEQRTVHHSELAQHDARHKGIERGLKSIVRQADAGWAFWALLIYAPVTFGIAWRLQCLLATQDIALTYRDATLLTFAGNFFNFAMPGTTGGDLYKAYHIAKRTHKRTEGITIIFLDRAVGLASFLFLAAITLLVSIRRDMVGEYGRWVAYLMFAFIVCFLLFFSQRVRKWIRYDALLARLPFADKFKRIDETTFSFRRHKRSAINSLLVTILAHLLFVTGAYFMARSLGIHPHGERTAVELYLACLIATVVGYLLAAVPISIQGFGLLEAVFIRVMVNGGWCNESQMLALTLSIRLIQMLWSLPGIVVPWLGFARPVKDAAADVATQ